MSSRRRRRWRPATAPADRWDFAQTHSLRVPRHSDDLEWRRLRLAFPLQLRHLPNRIGARPQSTRRRFADHNNLRSVARLFLGELTTAQERNANHREEAGRDFITVVAFPACRLNFRHSD